LFAEEARPVRICLISKEYPPDTGWGGIGAYTYQIAHGLKEIGQDVQVVSLMGREDPQNKPAGRESENAVMQEGIPVHRVAWLGGLSEWSAVHLTTPYTHYNLETNFALWRKFAQLHKSQPFDVVEAPEHLADGFMPALNQAAPLVIKLHTPQAKLLAERFHNLSPNFDQQFIAMIERVAMLAAEVLISPSEDLADWVARDLKYPRDDIRIVRNPVDANKFCPEGARAIAGDGKVTVLFVGRLEERKGIQFLVRAIPEIVKEFANVRFIIVGADTNTAAGQTSVLAELKGILAQSGCTDKVTFVPHVKLEDMPSYYRSADICVAPSLYDNAPYTCIEAMSCGKAFVGTSAGGMREYLTDGQSGLIVPPSDSGALAKALLSLLTDEAVRLRMGEEARKRVLERFHRTAVAQENVAIYTIAQERHAEKRRNAGYRGDGEQFLTDATEFFRSYNRMLYDMLYVHSLKFRLKHWMKKALTRLK
jgi:glycogen(starch) synthase